MKNNVKIQRTILGISQKELSEKMGVSRQTIHAIETGKYVPSTILCLKLGELLRIKIEELFELEDLDWK